jgi:PBP1b-binding outer membrane lipoprotein LpoB
MRITALILFAAFVLSGCAVVRTTASVAGTVVSTTVGVAGAAVKGTARAVGNIGDDEEPEQPAQETQ